MAKNNFIDFTSLLLEFKSFKRDLYAVNEERMENDSEHSFQLAMSCWYLNDDLNLELNLSQIIRFALIHDLVEVYSGDTPVFNDNPEILLSKKEREQKAYSKLLEFFENHITIKTSIEEYWLKNCDESLFVYEVDKILPFINIYLDNGRTWNYDKGSYQLSMSYIQSKLTGRFKLLGIIDSLKDKIENLINTSKIEFTLNSYPKSYGSNKIGEYRLKDYFTKHYSMDVIERNFNEFIQMHVLNSLPVKEYKGLTYLGSGWEWSAFKDNKEVVKIPAGIFKEVNTYKYLDNCRANYRKIKEYIPPEFVAETNFAYKDTPIIWQEYLDGNTFDRINIGSISNTSKKQLKTLMDGLMLMLEKEIWIPDLEILVQGDSLTMKNVVFKDSIGSIKLFDFSYYYDPFRMHPKLTKILYKEKKESIKEIIRKLNQC